MVFSTAGRFRMPLDSKLAQLQFIVGLAFQIISVFGKVNYAEPSLALKGIPPHDI